MDNKEAVQRRGKGQGAGGGNNGKPKEGAHPGGREEQREGLRPRGQTNLLPLVRDEVGVGRSPRKGEKAETVAPRPAMGQERRDTPLLGTTRGDTLAPFWSPRHCYLRARTA